MRSSAARSVQWMVFALLAALGGAEAVAVYVWNPGVLILLFQTGYALVTAGAIVFLGRAGQPQEPPAWAIGALLGGTFLIAVVVAQGALEGFANSGDEYGYNYVADTLLRGRLWNPAYPAALRDVLQTFYIGGHGDQRLSQYPPGWPVMLMPFKLIGAPQFGNAAVGLAAGVFLHLALRHVTASRAVHVATLALGLAAPFTLFNNASFFNHPLTAAALLAIAWLDLRNGSIPSAWNRFGIGAGFSVLLTTRYEAFLLCLLLYVADGFWRRGLGFVRWVLPAAAGGAPVALLFLLYNWRITGSALTTTLSWVSPQIGFGLHASGGDGPHSAARGALHTLIWTSSWQDFASVLLVPLYLAALYHRVAGRSLRWFDLLLPVVVVFFFFFPDNGGFQYGPRYWYLGHAAMPLTIAAGLPLTAGAWRLGRWRLDPLRLATAQLASFVGFTIGFAVFLHLQTENRLTPLRVAATAPGPALVLMRNFGHRYVAWQGYSTPILAMDYTRNGLDALGPVALGLDLGEERTARLCKQVPERAIYRVELDRIGPHGSLVPVCNGATPIIERP